MRDLCSVLDTLPLARQMHPGQRNSLDALCKRYGVDNSRRELHGALLDAQILLDVYLAMTGGQTALILGEATDSAASTCRSSRAVAVARPRGVLRIVRASDDELAAHERALAAIDKVSGGKTIWRTSKSRSRRRCAASCTERCRTHAMTLAAGFRTQFSRSCAGLVQADHRRLPGPQSAGAVASAARTVRSSPAGCCCSSSSSRWRWR